MPLLIDGHNLIGQLPDLHLDDPDDEIQLVRRLRAYAARTRKRITVVFDQGLPGGPAANLSGAGVTVVFASAGRSADRVLLERIRDERDPRGLIVVSSDREIARAAAARGMRVVPAEEFARQLVALSSRANETPDVRLTQAEVEEWLEIFIARPQRGKMKRSKSSDRPLDSTREG